MVTTKVGCSQASNSFEAVKLLVQKLHPNLSEDDVIENSIKMFKDQLSKLSLQIQKTTNP